MKLDSQPLFDALRRVDPIGMGVLEDLLHKLPQFVQQADRSGDIPAPIWDLTDLGTLNRMNMPVEFGGLASTATALRRAVVFERASYVCPGMLIGMPGPGLSMPPVLSLGTQEQKRDYFERFNTGSRPVWGAFAITEPAAGSDATAIRTAAVADGDAYVINGDKCFITNGARADVVVVFASINLDKGRFGIRAFVVPRDTPGFAVDRTEDMMGLRASQLTALSFNNCRIPVANMLGHNGKRGPLIDAFTGAQSAWDYMRPALSAAINGASLGMLDHAQKMAKEYIATRKQAGVLAAVAVLRAKLRSAQLLALRAAWKYDSGQRASTDASMAKAFASTLAMEIAEYLCSAFSLAGVMPEQRFEKFYRDAKAFDILEGTGDMQRLMIANAYEAVA